MSMCTHIVELGEGIRLARLVVGCMLLEHLIS